MFNIFNEKENYRYVITRSVKYDNENEPLSAMNIYKYREIALNTFNRLVDIWALDVVNNNSVIDKERDQENDKKYKIRNNLLGEDIVITFERIEA